MNNICLVSIFLAFFIVSKNVHAGTNQLLNIPNELPGAYVIFQAIYGQLSPLASIPSCWLACNQDLKDVETYIGSRYNVQTMRPEYFRRFIIESYSNNPNGRSYDSYLNMIAMKLGNLVFSLIDLDGNGVISVDVDGGNLNDFRTKYLFQKITTLPAQAQLCDCVYAFMGCRNYCITKSGFTAAYPLFALQS